MNKLLILSFIVFTLSLITVIICSVIIGFSDNVKHVLLSRYLVSISIAVIYIDILITCALQVGSDQ
jgi:hypothetical protein